MVARTSLKKWSDALSLEALDRLFEVDLRPLRNTNARILYKMFLDSKKSDYLTTLDIQDKLRSTDLTLHKKEINAWLKSLQSSGLITKEYERGKPTTIDYAGRYTYDLWGLTQKGRETARKLEIISSEKTSPSPLENIEKDANFETEATVHANSSPYADQTMKTLLRTITDSKGILTIDEIKAKMAPSEESLLEMMAIGNLDGILTIETLVSTSITEKIFGYLGIPSRRKYRLEVTDKGRNILDGYV
jgi:hypothetical protein